MGEPEFADRAGTALVTGGTGAIGAAVTRLLARRGSRVVFTYRRNADEAEKLTAELAAEGGAAEGHRLDLTDVDGVARLLGDVEDRHDAIHTVIYASGPHVPFSYLSRVSPDQFRDQVASDAIAFFNLVQPSIERLRRSKGTIVAVATAALGRAIVRDGLSAGPKGAVEGIVRTLALEEGRYGIRANCIGVGMTSVGMAADLIESGAFGESGLAEATANIPMRRFGTAEEVAEAVCFLASDRASFINGQTLHVDGGYSV